ncbi:dolichyl-phosphate beta-glucosyltransferase [Aspergillus undulatus]|uniref:dolichyl-phosphate beta-glucosyltransferase n=1 Tax=Aspergillus undulatus TaxID=1810928 RepID=UPI003CCD8E3E
MDFSAWTETCTHCVELLFHAPLSIIVAAVAATVVGSFVALYIFLYLVAPIPRPSLPEETTYRTIAKDGSITEPHRLPVWTHSGLKKSDDAEIFMSLVVPAYNEKDRLGGMLEEAVNYLEKMYGTLGDSQFKKGNGNENEKLVRQRKNAANGYANGSAIPNGYAAALQKGWEIIIVSDGSTDETEEMAFSFARDHQLSLHPKGHAGPWTPETQEGVHIPPGTIRVVRLARNRGKGGAVTHGMRHVRGQYVIFADADGATNFADLGKLVTACREVEDKTGRGVAVGSRAHMVGSDAVVKRSKLRNFLMHSFHLILYLLTPSQTAKIKDTQCGFKLFSRASLPFIIPYMHSEGWIFDVEMLMLAEFARIPVAEVPVDWREVGGSKLNVLWDSVGMAWGLAVLRGAWGFGVYRRR